MTDGRCSIDPTRSPFGPLCLSHRGGGIRHGYFTREGGVSGGIYPASTSAPARMTTRQLVAENRRRVAAWMGVPAGLADRPSGPFARCRRRPRTVFRPAARRPTPSSPTGRASPSAPPPPIAARCCLPTPQARVIGAAHAGWKGAFTGVLENTIAAMEGLGARRDRHRRGARPLDQPRQLRGRTGIRRPLRRRRCRQ